MINLSPNVWPRAKLSEVTINLDNKRKPLNGEERMTRKGKYPYYGANGVLDYIDNYIYDEKILCVAEDGGSWGFNQTCAYIIEEKCWVNNHAHVLKTTEKILPEFLMYYLNRADLNSVITGTTRGKLTKSALDKIVVPVPAIEIQRLIVLKLELAKKQIQQRQQSIQKLDELLQSVFYDMFGSPYINPNKYPVMTLDEVCLRKGEYGMGASAVKYDERLPRYVRITDIDDNGNLLSTKVSPDTTVKLNNYILHEGDLLFARSGATVGKTYLYKKEDGLLVFAGYLIRFKLNKDKINPFFMHSFTKTDTYRSWVKSKQNIVAQPNINAQQYGKELYLPIPPLTLQNKFAHIAIKLNEQRIMLVENKQKIENLFQSLLHQSFNEENIQYAN